MANKKTPNKKKGKSASRLNNQSPPIIYIPPTPPPPPPGFSPSVTLHTSNFTTAAGITDQNEIDALRQLMTDLLAANIWSKMDVIYPFSKTGLSAALYDFKNPTSPPLTINTVSGSTITHSANGVYIDNGFLAYGAYLGGPNLTITWNDYHWSFHTNGGNPFQEGYNAMINSSGGIADYYGGASVLHHVSSNYTRMRNVANTADVNLNSSTMILVASSLGTNNPNFAQVYRTSAANLVAIAPITDGGTPSYTGQLGIGGPTNGSTDAAFFATRVFSFLTFGKGLTPTESAALATAIAAFSTSLGRSLGN